MLHRRIRAGILVASVAALATAPMATADAVSAPGAQNKGQATGIDISNYQPNVDFKKVKSSGRDFVITLATDGKSFTNKLYGKQNSGAQKAGLYHGAYHFARPNQSSARSQADRFLKQANYKHDGKTLPPMLDMEPDSNGGCYGISAKKMNSWIGEFTKRVKEKTKRDAIIYTSPSFWKQCTSSSESFAKNPLNVAAWGVSKPSMFGGWKQYTFWQYSNKGNVSGISGDVDVDKFNGDESALKRFAEQ